MPASFPYYVTSLVSDGPPSRLVSEVEVCEDPDNKGAPTYRNQGI